MNNLSDFAVNECCAQLMGKEYHTEGACVMVPDFFTGIETGNDEFMEYDPCNDSSDAWPIILENRISIEFRDHKSLNPVAKGFGSNSHNIAHENPLRAAMMVFLRMKEQGE